MNQLYHYQYSGITQLLFRQRALWLLLLLALAAALSFRALFVVPDTRLDRMVPAGHDFIQNAQQFRQDKSSGSVLRVAVANPQGSILDYAYLSKLQSLNDEISLLAGVDTAGLNSLWAPSMIWFGITPQGFDSGPVIDNSILQDNAEAMTVIRSNILNAGIVGSYVANDFSASMISFEVLTHSPATGERLDTQQFMAQLETLRAKYQALGLDIHIIGELQKVSDLVHGFEQVALYFLFAALITLLLLYRYAFCIKATLIPIGCSVIAVLCQLGVLNLIGMDLGVYSVLVPFLIFAIAVSHGVQVINAFSHEVAKGRSNVEAAQVTFHLLHKAGLVALISDGIGFAMLLVIDIGVIRDLAIVACIGVCVVILTNLVLLPILLSYSGVSQRCVQHAQYKLAQKTLLLQWLSRFAELRQARLLLLLTVFTAVFGFHYSQSIKVGDLHQGAPELRPESRYNQDNRYITSHFSTSTDILNIFVGTPVGQCETFKVIELMDRLGWMLQNTTGVQAVSSAATRAKLSRYLGNEGNLKMMALPRDERVLSRAISNVGLAVVADRGDCSQHVITVELSDHKQETLARVTSVVRAFAAQHDDADLWFRMGDGSAAFEAATNEVIDHAQYQILLYVYAAVAVMCLLMFRSWRAVLCILLPLALTSILCQALMVAMDIGVKVATLPVIALGVGIGVDYGIYIFSRLQSYLALGHPMSQAYLETLKTTGKAVSFTGVTLAVGVATWIFSPIKFQADMGILLTFMFIWNMVGALTLLPALAAVLSVQPSKEQQAEVLNSAG